MKDSSTNGIIPADKLSSWQLWKLGELAPPLKGLTSAEMAKLVAVANPTAAKHSDANSTSPLADAKSGKGSGALSARFGGYPTAAELEAMHQEAWQAGYDAGLVAGRVVGYEEGRATGLVAGKEEVRDTFAESWEPMARIAHEFHAALACLEADLAADILKLSVVLAEHLVADHIIYNTDAIVSILRDVLSELPTTLPQGRLRVHPQDLSIARSFLEQETPQTVWQWVEEPAIERGGCILETPQLRLDLTLTTRLAILKTALGVGTNHDK